MPTVRQIIEQDRKDGVDPKETQDALKSLGLTKDDLDFDFDEAKRRGQSRLFYGADADKAINKEKSKKDIKETEEFLEKTFGFDVGTGTLESAFGMQGEKPFKPDYGVSAEKMAAKRRREKYVVPLAQEAAETFLPKEAYDYLPEFARPEDKVSEKDLRLELGPSAEKLTELGKATGKEVLSLASTLIPKPLARDAQDFYGLPEYPKTFEIAKDFISDIQNVGNLQRQKETGVRVAEAPITFIKNAKDVALGLAELINYYAGVNVREGITREDEAKRKAEETVASLTGIPLAIVTAATTDQARLFDIIENKPVDFLMTVMPAVNMVKSVPAASSFVGKLSKSLSEIPAKVVDSIPTKIKEGTLSIKEGTVELAREQLPTAVKAIETVKEAIPTKQTLADSFFIKNEPSTTSFVEQSIRTPEASAAAIKEASVKMSREKPPLVEETRFNLYDIDPLKSKLEDLVTIEIDGNPIEVKNKYLSSIDQEGFENINTASEVGAKAKAIYDDLQNSKKRVEELKDTVEPQVNPDSINDAIELYDRMLNENVDAPVKELENFIRQSVNPKQIVSLNDAKQLRDYFEAKYGDIDVIKTGPELVEQQKLVRLFEGKQNNKWKPLIDSYKTKFGKQVVEPEAIFDRLNKDAKLSFVENVVDYIKERNNILNKTNELSAVLSDRVVAPAKTREFYSITDQGRLSRGPERIQDVVQTYLKRLERKRPEGETKGPRNIPRAISEQTDILTSETFKQPLFPTKTEGAVQRLEQQKVKEVSRREPIKYLVKNEKYNKALSELANEVIKSYPDDVTGAITPERLASRFAFALDEQLSKGLPLLRSPELKRNVLKSIDKRLTGFTREQKRNILKDFNDTILREAVVENNTAKLRDFEIKDKNGNVVLNGDIVRDIIFENDKEAINAAKERAIVDIGEEIAQEAQYYQTRQAIKQESQRFFQRDDKGNINPDQIRNPEVYLFQVLSRVIGKGEALPVLSPFEGKKLANIAREAKETYANKIAQTSGFDKDYILKRIDSIADRYERMEKTDLSNIESLLDSERITQFKKVQPDNDIFENLYSLPEVNEAYKWEFASKITGQSPMSGLGLAQMAKRNLTARSFASMKNNMLSNMLASSLKSGNPAQPISVLKNVFDYKKYKKGGDISPVKKRAFQAIDRSGLFDTTELVRDIGTTSVSESPNVVARNYNKAVRLLEQKYSTWGDIPFKVEEATRTYERFEKALDVLEANEYIRTPISNNTFVQLTKQGNNTFAAELLDKKGKKVPNTKTVSGTIDNPEISKLLGRAASFEANKLFFDYGDVGTFNKKLRSYPVSNFLSGFYTWYSKSLDIPFVKRGMVSNTLFPKEYIASNSPKVIQQNMDTALAQSLRKAALVNALRGSFLGQEGRTPEEKEQMKLVKSALAFAPKDADTVLVGPLMDPSFVYYNDYASTVPFKATDVLSKLGADALLKVAGFMNEDDFKEKLFPLLKDTQETGMKDIDYQELKKEKERLKLFFKDLRGEQYSAKDVLSLVGLGGNAILSMIDKFADSEAQGKVVNMNEVARDFTGALIGKTPANLLLGAAGVVGDALDNEALLNLSPFGKEQKKYGFTSGQMAPDVQPVLLAAMSQIIGQGWRKSSLLGEKHSLTSDKKIKSRFEYYLDGAKKELQANLVTPLETRAQQTLAQSMNETDPERKQYLQKKAYFLVAQYETIKELIDALLDEERAKIYKLYK